MNSAPGGYLTLLKTPHVTPLFAWAALARLQFGVIPLALLLLFATQRHSYAEAGAATAAYGLTAGLLGPLRARAADHHGHGRALVVLSVLNGLGLLAMAVLATSTLPVLIATGLLAGGLAPPTGPVMRSTWRDLTAGETQLQQAFSLDSVAEEVLFVLGPLLAGGAIARFEARAVLGVSVSLLVLANLGLAGLLARATSLGATAAIGRRVVRWRSARFLVRLLPALAIGYLLAGFELAAIATVLHRMDAGLAGLPAALLSAGSIVGGLLYGRRTWPGAASHQAVACVLAGSAAVAASGWASGRPVLLLVLVAAAGLFVAPALVASYLVADAATEVASAESTSWVTSAFNVGAAAGTASAGVLVDVRGPGLAMVVGAAITVVLVAMKLLARPEKPRA
ncbi:MAG: MFS transporter [Kineosporiaceae bacterium]